ncbi:glycine betaine ABC transporter substrate-binding protein [Halomonas nitroreducens]|uniref:Glycine betaine ABC transporter substrate-binding protein n=1 Tax=Halomonas nitroreducens TaxID=447425 RepID=A0A3S0I7H7_9GAMM|nr:glycine betaine ABC transporter substrate-binding protein [Halomonas nitroreducens]RTR02949.1 glycine betaine ABC transporter substrate-binding protein [Halomonas nitroreducens]
MKKTSLTLLALGVMASGGAAQASDKSLVIGTNNWAENIAVANMWKILLEEDHAYDVELSDVGKSVLYSGLANGDFDLSLEIWLPTTDAPFLEPHRDSIDVHDVWYEGTGLGLVVPSYAEIDSIPELAAQADRYQYQGRSAILGIDPGSAIASLTEKAIEAYELPMNQINSSGPAMMAALDSAYRSGEPLVVTLWSPHWAFAEYDLKYLEDPQGVYGDNEDIYWMARPDLDADDPWLTSLLNAWKMDDDSLGSLMARIEEVGDPAEGARGWIHDNRDLIDSWYVAAAD